MSPNREGLRRAYAACEAMARAHYENFPVASRLLPPPMRPHVAAVYAFARAADDIADEGHAPAPERRRRLEGWLGRLHDAVGRDELDAEARSSSEDLIIHALSHSVRACGLPIGLFDDLVSAFAQDTTTCRYDSWADVFDYCRRSANPVGRLVLRIAGCSDETAERSSDALCTALQLTNFWQDFGRDWRAGRLYIPREVTSSLGADESDLSAGRFTAPWAIAVARCCETTAAKFEEGRLVSETVHGRLRYELRLTWLGGRRILDRVAAHRGNLLEWRPTLTAADVPGMFWQAARWKVAA